MDDEVSRAGIGVHRERAAPGAAAVGGHVHAAFRVGAEEVADRGDPHHVRIRRVHEHARDGLRLAQADLRERFAAVGGLVHPVSERGALAVVRFARADVQDVRIGRGDGDVPDRMRGVGVEDRRERGAVVDGLPDAARREADVVHRCVVGSDGDVVHASALANGADRAPAEAAEQRISRDVDGLRVGLRRQELLGAEREWNGEQDEEGTKPAHWYFGGWRCDQEPDCCVSLACGIDQLCAPYGYGPDRDFVAADENGPNWLLAEGAVPAAGPVVPRPHEHAAVHHHDPDVDEAVVAAADLQIADLLDIGGARRPAPNVVGLDLHSARGPTHAQVQPR